MTSRTLPACAALLRHVRCAELVRDLALLIAMGGLASFAILFTSRVVFDNVVHELSLSYAAWADGDAPGGSDLRLTTYEDANAAPADATTSLNAMSDSVNVTVVAFPNDPAPASRLLAGSIVTGAICADGVAIDEATASRLDVGVGDHVTLWWAGTTDAAPGQARVCGIANAWHPGSATGARGYLVAASSYLTQVSHGFPQSGTGKVERFWFESQPPGSQSRSETIRGTLFSQAGMSTIVWVIVALGALLWSFAVVRVWRVIRRNLQPAWSVVQGLGVGPSLLPALLGSVVTIMATLAGALSAVVARFFILGWTDLYVAARQIWLVAALMVAVALVLSVVLGRRNA